MPFLTAPAVELVAPRGTRSTLPFPAPPIPPAQSDYISFRHHTYEMPKGVKSVALKECGPRFEMKLYQVRGVGGRALAVVSCGGLGCGWRW